MGAICEPWVAIPQLPSEFQHFCPEGKTEGSLGQSEAAPQVRFQSVSTGLPRQGLWNLPEVTFVILNPAPVQQLQVFLLKRSFTVMCFLFAYVLPNRLHLGWTDRKATIPCLPGKFA